MRGTVALVSCLALTACWWPPPLSSERWLDFPAYPGARQLCQQSVDGMSANGPVGFTWHLYATHDGARRVEAYYRQNARESVVKEVDNGFTLRSRAGAHLSVEPAWGNHPTCGVSPSLLDSTVIIVSN